jgi:hypothetical protein
MWCISLVMGMGVAMGATAGLAEISVGVDTGDLRGSDGRALQAAVDYIAGLGGGTVRIGAGVYEMRNALILRDNVHVVGVPGETTLVARDGLVVPLAADGDANQREITVADPTGFRVGDGVIIVDDNSGGFTDTTATLTAQLDENTFSISRPLYVDYMVSSNARAKLAFPVVGGWQVKNATVEGLTIDGNRDNCESVGGCRAAGIYLFECEDITIRNCVVGSYDGDGISFQVSQRVTVEDCVSHGNAGIGIHPGSGSQDPIVRNNRSEGNDADGMYVCWRVKRGVFENNVLVGNARDGISIGHKDTDNLFTGNEITGNARSGVMFRGESEAMGAHRNVFERNRILDNAAAILMRGHHHDVVFRGNTIGYSSASVGDNDDARVGIRHGEGVIRLDADDNEFLNVTHERVVD